MIDETSRWRSLFRTGKPVLAMLHLGGDDARSRLQRAVEEARILAEGGVDAVIVENYFGDHTDVERALDALQDADLGVRIGVNVLRDAPRAFELARRFPVDFVQLDSVAGHLATEEDGAFAERLGEWRRSFSGAVLGGVRFKYQPVNSGRSEREDLEVGAERCDGIVVTGSATGEETGLEKIRRFREALGPSFPLIVGAGLTAENAVEQLAHTDGAIVGSYLKDTYRDTGVVDATHVRRLMDAVEAIRGGTEEQA